MAEQSIFQRRFSCREFHPGPLSEAQLAALLDAARWAPSAGNLQPWRFIVVTSEEIRRALSAAAHGQGFVAQAPAVIVVCALPRESARRYGDRGSTLYCLQDTAAAAQNILLAATHLGLAGCWVGAFDEAAVARVLAVPVGWRPVALLPVGYPGESPPVRRRRPAAEVVLRR